MFERFRNRRDQKSRLSVSDQYELLRKADFSRVEDCLTYERLELIEMTRKLSVEIKLEFEAVLFFNKFIKKICKFGPKSFDKILGPVCQGVMKGGRLEVVYRMLLIALSEFPYSSSVNIQFIKILFRRGELEKGREQLTKLLPLKNKWVAREVIDLALAMHVWNVLPDIIEQSRSFNDDTLLADKIRIATGRLKLSDKFKDNCSTPIFCINLDRDTHRFNSLYSLFRQIGYKIYRQSGVLGSSIPVTAINNIFKVRHPLNAIGCCLSHISVWEKLAGSTDQAALIIEDDGLPSGQINIQSVIDLLPQDFDICFVNDRSYETWFDNIEDNLAVMPVAASFRQVGADCRAIGADGYILSKRGAAKLMEIIQKVGIVHNLDWQLYALACYNVSIESNRHVDRHVRSVLAKVGGEIGLNAYVTSFPLIFHSPLGFTARYHFN